MRPDQVALVQSTFQKFVPVAYPASEFFYQELFRLAPETRTLFSADLTDQRNKLIKTLTTVVQGLNYPDALLPVVHALGQRHVGYHATSAHYSKVGEALIQTLRKYLGPEFTPEAEQAWVACYQLLSGHMQKAA